jgi:1,4-dihydroxy-2-naphthoyl-CoA hydrolase
MAKKRILKKPAKVHVKGEMSPLERVRNTVCKGGMVSGLHMHVKSLTRKKVTAEMRIRGIHLNHNGRVNGGALMAFADMIGAAGASMNRPARYRGGTIESKTNFFAPGRPPIIHAVSIPLHIGRTTSVWQTTLSNADGRVVAITTQTQIALPPEPSAAPADE